MSHPMYTFRTLEAQAALRGLQGWRRHVVRRGAPRLRLPRGRLPVRVGGRRPRSGRGRGASRMRSHLLEGIVRHRRVRPFTYALEHGVFYVALDLDELDEVPRRLRFVSRNRRNLLSFRDDDHLVPPAARRARVGPANSCGPRAWIPTAGRSRWSRTSGASATCSTRPASSSAAIAPASCGSSSSRSTTRTASGTCTRSARGRRRPAASSTRWTRRSTSRRSSRWPGATRSGSATSRPRLRITINEAQDGRPPAAHEPRPDPPTPVRPDGRCGCSCATRWSATGRSGMIHWHALRLWLRGARFHRHGEATR